jgi:hypothetical protein
MQFVDKHAASRQVATFLLYAVAEACRALHEGSMSI